MPPTKEVIAAIQFAVVPAAAAASLVFLLLRWAGRGKATSLAAALALVAGLGVGIQTRAPFPMKPSAKALAVKFDLADPGETKNPPALRSHEWLAWVTLAAVAVGLAVRTPKLPADVGWLLRAAAALLAVWLVVPIAVNAETSEVSKELSWVPAAFALAMLAEWVLLEHLARDRPGVAAFGLAVSAFAAAVVLIHASSALLADAATILAASLGGLAVVAAWKKADEGAAVPGAVVLLLGLLAVGKDETFSEVPAKSFLYVGLAPLALAPLAIPRVARWRSVWAAVIALALVAVPLTVAVRMAMLAAPLEDLG